MSAHQTTNADSLPGRLRGTITTITTDPDGDVWRLRKEAASEIDRLRAALEWYGENTRLARLIHSEGDKGRHALSDDGGKRAREALGE